MKVKLDIVLDHEMSGAAMIKGEPIELDCTLCSQEVSLLVDEGKQKNHYHHSSAYSNL